MLAVVVIYIYIYICDYLVLIYMCLSRLKEGCIFCLSQCDVPMYCSFSAAMYIICLSWQCFIIIRLWVTLLQDATDTRIIIMSYQGKHSSGFRLKRNENEQLVVTFSKKVYMRFGLQLNIQDTVNNSGTRLYDRLHICIQRTLREEL